MNYIKKEWRILGISTIFIAVSVAASSRSEFLKGNIIDAVLAGKGSYMQDIGFLCLMLFLQLFTYYIFEKSRFLFLANTVKALREDFFASILRKSYVSFQEKGTRDYVARYSNRIEMMQRMYFATIPMLVEVIVKIVIIMGSLIMISIPIAVVSGILLTSAFYVPKLIEKRLKKAQSISNQSLERHIRKLQEWLENFEEIKNYHIEKVIRGKFSESAKDVKQTLFASRKLFAKAQGSTLAITNLIYIAVILVSAELLHKGVISAGQILVVIGLINQLIYPVSAVSTFIQNLISVRPVKDELLREMQEMETKEKEYLPEEKFYPEIRVEHLGFSYSGVPVFQELDYHFAERGKYLIQGRSGVGKTTLLSLILGYYTPQKGQVSLAGKSTACIGNLMDYVAVMRQESIFFEDTIENNITMYQKKDQAVVKALLRQAGLSKYAYEDGLKTVIQGKGTNLSGGEKRRLFLIRTILSDKPVLIFDEPLENLDPASQKIAEDMILGIENRLVIVVSHRFSGEKLQQFDGIWRLGER